MEISLSPPTDSPPTPHCRRRPAAAPALRAPKRCRSMIWEGKDAHLLVIRPDHGKLRATHGPSAPKTTQRYELAARYHATCAAAASCPAPQPSAALGPFQVRGRRPMAGRGARAVGQTGAGTGGNTGAKPAGSPGQARGDTGKVGGDTGTETGGDTGPENGGGTGRETGGGAGGR